MKLKKITKKDYEKVLKLLGDYEIYAEVNYDNYEITIDISWGDWKHTHMLCDRIMEQAGFDLDRAVVTEEDGSDTYSASRTYVKL